MFLLLKLDGYTNLCVCVTDSAFYKTKGLGLLARWLSDILSPSRMPESVIDSRVAIAGILSFLRLMIKCEVAL